ncbi:hypothetical protein AB835_00055 [Candidatus Endobugula sertula]|uniref:OmpA-like domain-containing protein n=1 Tax=Candidatus Endobugula sertula TaxID=62101 RepID=A0A1D2QU46_9GAMM|nr:hypothetical protein AB835_00055 [Candidatus Endobugula sertula]
MNLLVQQIYQFLFARSYACVVVLLLGPMSLNVQAEFTYPDIEDGRFGGFTLTPMLGSHRLDDERGLDNEHFVGLAVGYRFSAPYALEFFYADADATTTAGVASGDLRQFRLEVLYDVAEYGHWTPYVALGAASTEFGTTTTADDEGAMTLGVGTHYRFSDRLALRLDTRYLKGVGDIKGADLTFAVGLNVFLGNVTGPVVEPVAQYATEESAPALTRAERCTQAGGMLSAEGSCIKTSFSTDTVKLKVQFEHNSVKVKSAYLSEVQELADFMKAYSSSKVVLEGHTDSMGSDAYNQALSQRRVDEIVHLLSDNYGISVERMSAIGYGEAQPVASNDTSSNRAKNRRVVANVTVEREETIQLDIQ